MSLPDEEFDVLGEDELALLTRRFERMHENRVNSRRNSRTCFKCDKVGHFFAECPKVNNHDKHKFKDKRKKFKKKDHGHGKKTRSREKMKRSSDIQSDSEDTSSSSSDEDEEDDKKKRKKNLGKYLNGLCVTGLSLKDDFYDMARSSSNKRSQKDASDLDSEDEVCDELSSLRKENEELVDLLDNRDHMLRESKKLTKELRALLEDARTRVDELETQVLDGKLEIDSLKDSPIVSDEIDCVDCSVFLADLTAIREKHASKCEELDVLRVELAELQSRPTLLGACTSCPGLHEKIVELRSRIISLEADLKVPIPTSCSTCELHVMKNLELAQCVDHLRDENCKLREVLSWLSSQEPQLGVLIASYKRFDSWALGSDKFGESNGEREGKSGNVPVPPQPTPKDKFASKPNQSREKPSEKASEKPSEKPSGKPSEKPCEEPHPKPKPRPIRFHCGFCGKDGHKREFSFKRKREKRMAKEWANKDKYHYPNGVLEPRVQMPRAKASVRIVPTWRERKATGGAAGQATSVRPVRHTGQTGVGLDRQQVGFRARIGVRFGSRGRGSGGWSGEFAGGQFARHSPPPRAQYGDGRSRSLELERRDGPRSSFRGFGPPLVSEGWFPRNGYHGGVEFAGRSPPRDQYEFGRGCSFEPLKGYGPCFPFRGSHTPPMRQEWSSHGGSMFDRVDRMDRCIDRHGRMNVANPTFEEMA
jgi:hypothetical protein